MTQQALFETVKSDNNKFLKTVNVASVPQRSPFRYPGGKTWFIPMLRKWLSSFDNNEITLVEPFAGGGIVSVTAACENLANRILMNELDPEVAAVWHTIFGEDNQWLCDRIMNFQLTLENAIAAINLPDKTVRELAFSTILKNRIYHGGIIAKGSGPLKSGENGKGIASRWYPDTLKRRIREIDTVKHKFTFEEQDAFNILEAYAGYTNFCFFIDPPYVKAGKRLYTYFDIDHEKLFKAISKLQGNFLITYDDADEIRYLVSKFGFQFRKIPMKTTHHLEKNELIIANNFDWFDSH